MLSLALAMVLPVSFLSVDGSSAADVADSAGPSAPRVFAHLTWALPVLALPGAKLDSLSCGSPSSCVAIDGSGPGHVMWDGHTWSRPDFEYDGTHVSCSSATFCLAVGSLGGGAKSYVWNGQTWSTGTMITSQDVFLSSVSCISATSCVAVDESGDAYRWNGSTWAQTVVEAGSQLYLVSCVPDFCLAVDQSTHAFTWSGGSWLPVAGIPSPVEPESLSCASASLCALGSFEGSITMWDGAGWTPAQKVDASNTDLRGMSCPSVTFCMAVDFGGRQMLWNGSRWSKPAYLELPYGTSLNATSLSCTVTFCAVGDEGGTLATTTSVKQPTHRTSYHFRVGGELNSVASTSTRNAWAVGHSGSPEHPRPLVVHWDGSRWTAVAGLQPRSGVLYGVSATSARNAWAVGVSGSGPDARTLIEHWDGQVWTQQGRPLPGSLAGVAAISRHRAWAVGTTTKGRDLILRWDGTTWRRVRVAGSGGRLTGVAVHGTRHAWAVGATNHGRAQILRWNGKHWNRTRNPQVGVHVALDTYLNAVTYAGPKRAWAVGELSCGCGPGLSLIDQWGSGHWRRVPSPSTHGGTTLTRVASIGHRSAWAVGVSGSGDGPTRTLILRRTASGWKVVHSPSPGSYAYLRGVAAASHHDAWAVGSSGCRDNRCRTIVEHWNGHAWT
jgi:hypothetical protein